VPSFIVDGQLTNFGLGFKDILTVSFDALTFHAEKGAKTSLVPSGLHLDFDKELQFLNALADLLPAGGLEDLPAVQVSPQGVAVDYSLGLPGASIAIFSLTNVNFSTRLWLPFPPLPAQGATGDSTEPEGASVRIAFSERDHPFQLTVAMLGGTGFFAMEAEATSQEGAPARIKSLEGQIEVAANITVDLVIVSASVYADAGFYFGVSDSGLEFSGHLRIGGAVELLGIAGISIEIYLELSYHKSNGSAELSGRGTVTVGVHVLAFTKSVTLSYGRSFPIPDRQQPMVAAGIVPPLAPAAMVPTVATAEGSPSFEDLLSRADWETYCRAYA
jgi:hypothetical protein